MVFSCSKRRQRHKGLPWPLVTTNVYLELNSKCRNPQKRIRSTSTKGQRVRPVLAPSRLYDRRFDLKVWPLTGCFDLDCGYLMFWVLRM